MPATPSTVTTPLASNGNAGNPAGTANGHAAIMAKLHPVPAAVYAYTLQPAQAKATRTPAQWGTLAGYPGSKASALRQAMARSTGNGCGQQGRYPAVTGAALRGMLAASVGYRAAMATGNAGQATAAKAKVAGTLASAAKANMARAKASAKASAK